MPNILDRANTLLAAGSCAEAEALCRESLRGQADQTGALLGLAAALRQQGRLDAAIDAYRQALSLDPDLAAAHVGLAAALLLDGQLEEGFEEYEWRSKLPGQQTQADEAPEWDGLIDPKASLLLCTEQNTGDTLQFARYIPFIAAQGMRVIVQCPEAVERLLQSIEGVASTYRLGEALPAHKARLSLLSLPRLFATRIDKIPTNIPYLRPEFAEVQRWRERLLRLGETIKVGLRWSADEPAAGRGSCPLALFRGLAGVDKLTLVGLNDEALGAEEEALAREMGVVDYSADLGDLGDTAALVANLDLVISVDAAVLHLAGALGRPAWALLPYSPHWSWLLERDEAAWYPGMQLFRQPRPGDWTTVTDHLVETLVAAMRISRDDAPQTGKSDV